MIEHLRSGAVWDIGVHLKLLFSVNCQTTIASRAILCLHFHHLWVYHTVHHIALPHMWVRHTVRNVSRSHLGFPFPVGLAPSYRSLQGYSYLTFPSLAGPPLHYLPPPICGSATLWEMWVSHILDFPFRWVRHLPHSVTIAFRPTRILLIVGVDIPVDRSFHSYQNPDNFKSWRSCSYQSYQKSGRHYASHQLLELTT